MRKRLVLTFVALTVLIVGLYGIPRAIIRIDQVHDREQEQVDQSALLLAGLVAADLDAGDQITQQTFGDLLRPGERVEYTPPDGAAVAAGEPADQEVGVEATEPVAGGGFVTLEYSQEAIDQRVRAALSPLLFIGLLIIVLAWLAAMVLAGRLARPFQDLARHAHQLGAGRFDLDVPHYDVPEAEEVGQALVTSARSLDQLVRRERDFAVNASHELRTPLTAVRLHLEDLSMWPSTSPEVSEELAVALAELSRLESAVTALLGKDRADRAAAAEAVDVGALLTAAAERWRPVVTRRGRELETSVTGELPARLSPAAVTEVLDAILGHSLEHGRGRVSLSAERTADYLEVRVGDESRRTQGTELLHGNGESGTSGLPRASALVAALGGNLTVDSGPHTTFVLRLPPA
ncbi:MAG TPA: HAMP domain-containing sensor histidine kinase [Nocardioides sp.]|jgi:signal transduction histidine kinase|nr:HAMP domain-containing sensor histidine kinase [Nocardioides sp.]